MFRRDAYLAAGGYRWPFYYGQDWDLWYRLAERGAFALIPEVLYRARLFPDGISACHRVRQEQLGRLSLEAFRLRRQGLPEEQCLRQAAAIRPGRPSAPAWRSKGEGAHLIGELLRTRGDTRCRPYFLQALRSNPFRLNSWVRLLQSFAGGGS
jgi:hypothetical protein